MPVEIQNLSTFPATLPYPMRGVLKPGQSITLDTTPAALVALVPGLDVTFKLTERQSYPGPFDSAYGVNESGGGGTTWRTGSGVPDNSVGANGDLYLRTSNGDVYQKSSGTYSVIANLTGPTGATGAAGATGATGADGALVGEVVWLATATANPDAYSTSGMDFTPLRPSPQSPNDTLRFQIHAARTGNMRLSYAYAMSVANGGNVRLRLSKLLVGVGGDPNGALVAASEFSITPGNNTTRKALSESDSATLEFAVTAGDVVICLLERMIGVNDTHTGDMRMIEARVRYA